MFCFIIILKHFYQLFIFPLVVLFSSCLYRWSHFFIFAHPPHFLLYLHLYFTPSLSCCLSVMWSRTDAGSPNCGTAISALLWLLGSLSETGIGDAPPSPSASKRKKRRGRVSGLASRLSAKIQMIPLNFSIFRMGSFTSAVQQKRLCMWCIRGAKTCTKNTRPNPQDGGRCSLWCCPPSNVCDGKCCVQILCHHA